jgi:hypothetical protein
MTTALVKFRVKVAAASGSLSDAARISYPACRNPSDKPPAPANRSTTVNRAQVACRAARRGARPLRPLARSDMEAAREVVAIMLRHPPECGSAYLRRYVYSGLRARTLRDAQPLDLYGEGHIRESSRRTSPRASACARYADPSSCCLRVWASSMRRAIWACVRPCTGRAGARSSRARRRACGRGERPNRGSRAIRVRASDSGVLSSPL